MSNENIPAHLLVSESDHVPSDTETTRLREKAVELGKTDVEISDLELKLKELSERRRILAHREIPEIMAELGIDRLGIPELNADIVEKPYYKASIAASWPEDRRAAAFDWLEKNGHGALVRVTVSVSFGKSEMEKARELEAMVRQWSNEHMPKLAMDVPWNTLTSFVREQLEAGEVIPLETLGAEVGRIAEIKKRK